MSVSKQHDRDFCETKKSLRGRDFFSFEISLYFSKYFSLHLFIFILLRSPLITFKLQSRFVFVTSVSQQHYGGVFYTG